MCGQVNLLGFLRHGREEGEGPLLIAVEGALELVSQTLELKLVLQQTVKQYGLFGAVRGGGI